MPELIAIGDIHGMYEMLDTLLQRLPPAGSLVFLGDYIDRGPSSKQVISRLMRLASDRTCVFLRGNHEAMALDALAGGRRAELLWLWNGGAATLESYEGRIPAKHMEFLCDTRAYYATEAFIFVHAGLVPGRQPEETDPEELWWMREPFLSSAYDWGRRVIHGHTPTLGAFAPDVRPNRINIDTGAVYGGPLTALLLPEVEFISV